MQTTGNKPQLLVAWSASSTDHRSDDYFPPFNKQCLKGLKYLHMGTEANILSN